MSRLEDHVGVPVFFRCRGDVYRGIARYYASWYHVYVTGYLWKTGGWGSAGEAGRWGDDKFAIREDQLVELENGRSIQVEYLDVEPTTIEPGEYALKGMVGRKAASSKKRIRRERPGPPPGHCRG